jgi:DNA-nicking Smr family endonuclease
VATRHKASKSRSADLSSPDASSDAEAFARAMSDVVPLPADGQRRAGKFSPHLTTPPVQEPGAQAGSRREDFVAPGVDRREIRRLRRGTYTVQARMDLHGHTLAEAAVSVHRFIERSRQTRHRCVCIVHGRGLNSPGGVSVLREPVREHLTRLPSVLAFCDAPQGDGGAGAVYVLLRR